MQLARRALAAVGQKQKPLVFLAQPGHKFLHARQQHVAVIDHAVHIADKALLFGKVNGVEIHSDSFPPPPGRLSFLFFLCLQAL